MLRLSSATYRKQGKRPSPIDDKLQTLLLRCQGLIYLRLFRLREAELKRAQRQTAELKALVRGWGEGEMGAEGWFVVCGERAR